MPWVVRENSPGTATMESPVNYAVNFWKFGCKITVFPEIWAWLSPSTWNNILSLSTAQLINLSN